MKRPNKPFDSGTQRHCAARLRSPIRFAAQCRCVPVNSDVSAAS